MPDAWAQVDALKQERRARVQAKDAERERWRQEKALRFCRRNVERWFRELPADMVHALVVFDATAFINAGILPAGLVAVASDWLLEHGFGPKTPRPLRPPSSGELAMLRALKACRFPPASFAKRFVRELSDDLITDGQAAQLRRLVKTFRRQIPMGALHEGDRHLHSKSKKSQR